MSEVLSAGNNCSSQPTEIRHCEHLMPGGRPHRRGLLSSSKEQIGSPILQAPTHPPPCAQTATRGVYVLREGPRIMPAAVDTLVDIERALCCGSSRAHKGDALGLSDAAGVDGTCRGTSESNSSSGDMPEGKPWAVLVEARGHVAEG